ncbi:hypothetical protein ACFOSV_05655 [Algoriphagus namhaensis]|uniref:Uncharacterized protein n=1 Tax=Algoriphagus namhaensis TaxID=915353 RepID=A0ABV8ANW7_9BACT
MKKVTSEVNYLDQRTRSRKNVLFNGLVGDSGFRISKVIDRGDTFLPLILGKIEDTPRGSIIFLKYKFFPGAIFFLAFWSLVLIGFSAFFIWGKADYVYSGICLALAILNYFISNFFFQRQVKLSRKIFINLISFQMKD